VAQLSENLNGKPSQSTDSNPPRKSRPTGRLKAPHAEMSPAKRVVQAARKVRPSCASRKRVVPRRSPTSFKHQTKI